MTKIEALKKSIEKWENIAYHGGVDEHADNCALCQEYSSCGGCPVEKKTGHSGCSCTPYTEWCDYIEYSNAEGFKVFDEYSKELAIKEIEFLKSLLADTKL